MEMLFLRLTNPSLDSDRDALLRRIADLEDTVRSLAGRMESRREGRHAAGDVRAAPPEAPLGLKGQAAHAGQDAPDPVGSKEEGWIAQAEDAAERYRLTSLEEPAEELSSVVDEHPVEDEADSRTREDASPMAGNPPALDKPAALDSGTAPPGEQADGKARPFSDWPDVVAALSRKNPLMASVLRGSNAYVQGDLLLIDSRNAQFLDLIREGTRNRGDIREAALAVTGRQFRLGPYRKQEAQPEADPFATFLERLRGTDAKVSKTE